AAFSRGRAIRLDLARSPVELRRLGDTLMAMAEEIRTREHDMRRSVTQREVLLKEVHHRVKNSLQIATSLLNLQARGLQPESARQALIEAQARIRALALVHRHLYGHEDLRHVDLRPLIDELLQLIMENAGTESDMVDLASDIESVVVAADKAAPIVLIATEALTDALKRVASLGWRGRIEILLRAEPGGTGLLRIADDAARPGTAEGMAGQNPPAGLRPS